jgi:hypothetical protein
MRKVPSRTGYTSAPGAAVNGLHDRCTQSTGVHADREKCGGSRAHWRIDGEYSPGSTGA